MSVWFGSQSETLPSVLTFFQLKVSKNEIRDSFHTIDTDFEIPPSLQTMISRSKGISQCISYRKYTLRVLLGKMFDFEEVTSNISKILDAWILANPETYIQEVEIIRDYAEKNGLGEFLKQYIPLSIKPKIDP